MPEVDHWEANVTGVLLGPDGEPLIIQTDERVFGYQRWLYEDTDSDYQG